MLRRRRRDPLPTVPPDMNTHVQAVVVAGRDTAAIARVGALAYEIGLPMQGRAGTVIGYDQGDPGRTLTGPVNAQGRATEALNRLGTPTDPRHNAPVPEMSDKLQLDGYQQALWHRRRR